MANQLETNLDGPVGLRWRRQNVANHARDQRKVIDLLAKVSRSDGGKKEAWLAPPLSGPDGSCPPLLVDAIWDFQVHWKTRGVFRNIDAVVDPRGNTMKQLAKLVYGRPNAEPDSEIKDRKLIVTQPRAPGTWQVVGIWSATIGEVGQVGAVQLDIAQPDDKKFRMTGIGAGLGVSIDPVSYLKLLKGVADPAAQVTLKAIIAMIAKGVSFNIGDYLQKFDWLQKNVFTSVTGGRLIANPINGVFGRPTAISRYMITGAAIARNPFMIVSAGGGALAGGEAGVLFMGGGATGVVTPILSPVLGTYGTAGVTLKLGVGVQGLLYHLWSVEDI